MSKFIAPVSTNDAYLDGRTPAKGELIVTKAGKLRFGDGATKGGVEVWPNKLGEAYVYGAKKDTEVSNPSTSMQRIVLSTDGETIQNVDSFTQLPCHDLRRCVQAWNSSSNKREVQYYLNAGNSNLKATGGAADLTGGDGDVMVEAPVGHYRLIKETDSVTGHAVYKKLISDKPFPNSSPFPAFYISYGGDTLQKQYVGAFQGAIIDNVFRSVAGVKPTVSQTRATFRSKAVAGHATLCNWLMKVWFGWLIEIEFANTDVQAAVSLGFSELSAYDYAYVRKSGRTAALGNATGEIIADSEAPTITAQNQVFTRHPASDSGSAYAWEDGAVFVYTNSATPAVGDTAYSNTGLTTSFGTIAEKTDAGEDYDLEGHWQNGAKKVVAMSYRGIENLWGNIWENDDGIQKYQIRSEADIYCTENGVAVKYDRHPENDHKISDNPATWAYAWFNASTETTIFTADEHAAVNAATYSDNTLTTDRNLPVTAFDDDFRESGFWFTTDINQYSQLDTDKGYGAENTPFPATGYTGANIMWVSHAWPKAGGYIRGYDPLTYFPTNLSGGSATTYLADYFYNDTATGARLVLRGGSPFSGRYVGVFYVYVGSALSHTWTSLGARLAAVEQTQAA
ncbi:MAG: hypothetical protein PUC15_08080 [Lentisphaeria bacterium]|nr:hypothetical protein [Lentisphaeria bacterium]